MGYNCGNRRSRRWNPYLSAIPSVSASGALRFDRRIRLEFRGAQRLRPWDCAARQGRNPPCRSRQDALRLQLERRSHNALGLPAGAGWRLDHAAWNTDRPTRAQRIGVVDAVAASQRRSDQRQHLVPSVRPSRRAAEVKVMVDEFPQAQVPGEGGRQEQAGIGHQAMVVKEDADTGGFVLRSPARISRIVPSSEDLREAAQVIAQARMPLIYAGGGVGGQTQRQPSSSWPRRRTYLSLLPAAARGVIPDSHPLSYGSCFSPRGERQEMNQLYEVMQSADVVIGIGARFSLGNPAGEASTLVNINIDDTELTRHQVNTISLHGDARATIEALSPFLMEAGAGERPSSAEAVSAARSLIAYYDIRLSEPQYPVLEAMQSGIPEDAFTVWDVTQFAYYGRTHWHVNHPKTYIDSGYSFNLGYAFPTGLGVKVAQPDRPVICMTGDGGFMFNSSELSTAVQYGVNVVTVIFRNDSYGNVARDLNEMFGGAYGTDLHNPDFVRFAESFGAVGMRADDPMELETLIPLALEQQRPVLIDVPFGEMPIPRAPQIAFVYNLPWTQPQEGLISS